ncbi:MAG: Ig-like domain-containing protein [Lachnospiraceae bacterium]|nr:Ig-like domain-containing protein [Lachnospiraceae bacterium]
MHVYNYVKTGSYTTSLYVRSVTDPELTYELSDDTTLVLPETVDVIYSKTKVGTVAESVSWDEEEAAAVDLTKAGTYTVSGVVTLSQDCTDGTETVGVTCYITVIEANLITDSDVAGFEKNVFTVDGDNAVIVTIPSNEDVLEGDYAAHWWNSNANETLASTISYKYGDLEAGYYTFEITGMGIENDGITALILDADGNVIAEGDTGYLYGWTLDSTLWTTATVTFYLAEATDVTLAVRIDTQSGGWGSVDSMYLHRHAATETVSNGDGSHYVICTDCLTQLTESETCTYELTSATEATCTEEGEEIYTCSACGDSYSVTIEATGHTVVIDEAVAATYKSTGLTEGSHCSVCGEVIVAQEIIPALTYDYDNDDVSESVYSAESYAAYKAPLEALQAALADPDNYTDAEIDALITAYESAKAGLTAASGSDDNDESDEDDVDKDSADKVSTDSGTTVTSVSTDDSSSDTGDNTGAFVFVLIFAIALAVILITCIPRKDETVE